MAYGKILVDQIESSNGEVLEVPTALSSIATNTADIETNTTSIATNTSTISNILGVLPFYKTDLYDVCFKAPTTTTVSLSCDISVVIDGTLFSVLEDTAVSLPTLTVGTDYAIYCDSTGNLTASGDFELTTGLKIGGFHYGNGAIKEYSFWDLKFRPKCEDPRGMVIDPSRRAFWSDIYLLNNTPDALGTSCYNATIADGDSPCVIPALFGGDGSTTYSNHTWYLSAEVLSAYGKRHPTHAEFTILAKGTTTGYAVGSDPVTTKFDSSAESTIGCEQVSGHMYQWGAETWDRGNGATNYSWYTEDTNNEGNVFGGLDSESVGAVRLGGNWVDSGHSGARCSSWGLGPWYSLSNYGSRGVCDHLCII